MMTAMSQRKRKAIGYLARHDDDMVASIRSLARRSGWSLEEIVVGGKAKRDACFRRLRRGEASVLMLGRLRDVSPVLTDLTSVCRRAAAEGWILTSVDVPLRTDTPAGRALTTLLDAMMEFERKDLGARVRRGIEKRRATGARFGRPRILDPEIIDQICRARNEGGTYKAIADDLNERGVATAHGGARWYPSTVRKVIEGAEAVSA